MLQRVKAEVYEVRGFRMAKNAEDATVIVEMVVENAFEFHHGATFARRNFSLTAGIDSHDNTKQESNTPMTASGVVRSRLTLTAAAITLSQFKTREIVRLQFLHFSMPQPVMKYMRAIGITNTASSLGVRTSFGEESANAKTSAKSSRTTIRK